MNATPTRHQVEMCSMRLSERGDGFVMDLANRAQEAIRLEFPDWILHQLMRALPHIDAALAHGDSSGALIAYPLARWSVASAGTRQPGVALHLRDDRHVDAAFHLQPEQALALHRALGQAIAEAASTPTLSAPASP
ncbi:MAG: hypothetical protein QM750_20290 [Rubrivivax sp.]